MCFCLLRLPLTLALEYTCFSVGLRSFSISVCTVIPILLAPGLWLQSREPVMGPAQRWAKHEFHICIHYVHVGMLNRFVILTQGVKSKRSLGYNLWLGDTLNSNLLLLAMPISLVHNLISVNNKGRNQGQIQGEITASACLWAITLTEEKTCCRVHGYPEKTACILTKQEESKPESHSLYCYRNLWTVWCRRDCR